MSNPNGRFTLKGCILGECRQVGPNGEACCDDTFLQQRPPKVMVVDDVVLALRADDCRQHVVCEELGALVFVERSPLLAFEQDLRVTNGNLGGAQRPERRFHNVFGLCNRFHGDWNCVMKPIDSNVSLT